MILYDSRAANSPSPRIRRAKTPFARLCSFDGAPLRQPPSAAGPAASCRQPSAVMRPKLFCPISRSNKSSTSPSYMRSHLSTPSSAAERPPARPVPAPRDHAGALRQPPVCRHAPKTFLPNLSQTLVNSRPSLVNALLPFNPSIRRQRATSPTRTRPPRPHARPRQPPVCPVAPKISCPISHNLS